MASDESSPVTPAGLLIPKECSRVYQMLQTWSADREVESAPDPVAGPSRPQLLSSPDPGEFDRLGWPQWSTSVGGRGDKTTTVVAYVERGYRD